MNTYSIAEPIERIEAMERLLPDFARVALSKLEQVSLEREGFHRSLESKIQELSERRRDTNDQIARAEQDLMFRRVGPEHREAIDRLKTTAADLGAKIAALQ